MSAKKRQKVNFPRDSHEKAAWASQGVVCGIDEVGRGCLAGPLVTAAVILHPGKTSRMVKDSKLLTESERLQAARWILKNSWHSYGVVHHRGVDSHNIWQATLIAMKMAVVNLLATAPIKPQSILVDAMPLNLFDTNYAQIPVHYFDKGESLSSSIAAASILAKIKRDAMMTQLDALFPGYHLHQHKGYSTQAHQDAVLALQRSIIHRQSFLKKLINTHSLSDDCHEEQQTIC